MKEYKKPVVKIVELNFALCVLGEWSDSGDENANANANAKKGSLIDLENE